MNPITMADTLGIEVYAVDGLTDRARCATVEGVPVVWVRSGLGRQERDYVVWKMIRRLRDQARSASAAQVPQALCLH